MMVVSSWGLMGRWCGDMIFSGRIKGSFLAGGGEDAIVSATILFILSNEISEITFRCTCRPELVDLSLDLGPKAVLETGLTSSSLVVLSLDFIGIGSFKAVKLSVDCSPIDIPVVLPSFDVEGDDELEDDKDEEEWDTGGEGNGTT